MPRSEDEENIRDAVGAGCCLSFLIVGCTLLGTSFAVIAPHQVGLRWNPTYYQVETDKVWTNGRHCIGPGACSAPRARPTLCPPSSHHLPSTTGHDFVKFSQRIKTINFGGDQALSSWSMDKQEIHLDLAVLYRIDLEAVPSIFKKYNTEYKEVWKQIMMSSIKGRTKNFKTTDYFEEREVIKGNLTEALVEGLAGEGVSNVTIIMRSVVIPFQFEDALSAKVVKQQEEFTALMQRNVTLIEARTSVLVELAQQESNVIKAEAEAAANVVKNKAVVDGEELVQASYTAGFLTIANELGFDKAQLIQYIQTRSLAERGANKKIVAGFVAGGS